MATSKAIAAYRGARAVELAVAGWSYDAITRQFGYRSSGAVAKAMRKTVNRRVATGVDEHRSLELERLDALQPAHWTKAMDGDTKAAGVVLSVIDKRMRLLGLVRGGDGSDGPGEVVDGAFWEHIRELHVHAARPSRDRGRIWTTASGGTTPPAHTSPTAWAICTTRTSLSSSSRATTMLRASSPEA